MSYTVHEWLNLALRWFHVFAAILWIGQTYFFTWLDREMGRLEKDAAAEPHIWMVHSGGFYVVEKRRLTAQLTQTLHWFKWEAALTWLSGMALLALVYHAGGLTLDRAGVPIPPLRAAILTLALLAGAWIVYDGLWRSPLARVEAAGVVISYGLIVGVAYGLTRVMSGRAAFIHVGAMLGTLMAANVWQVILPGQRRMLAAVAAGRQPDPALAARAKLRSRHNTFMVQPVLFIMLSNHFPVTTYGHAYSWVVLSGLVLVGWGAAAVLRRI